MTRGDGGKDQQEVEEENKHIIPRAEGTTTRRHAAARRDMPTLNMACEEYDNDASHALGVARQGSADDDDVFYAIIVQVS